jgi:competence protein ComEC
MGWKSTFVLAGICLALWVFSRRYWLIALALVIGSVTYSLHAATLQQSVIAQAALAREDVTVEVVVTSDVKRTKHRVRGSTLNRPQSSFLARAEALHLADQSYQLRLPIRIISREEVNVVPGDRFEFAGTLIVTREKRVAATLITPGVPVQIDEAGLLAKHLAEIRSRFRDITQRLGGDAGTLIPGMILGDTSLQSEEFAEQMRKSGLSHLTAVSGANFAIVSALVFWLSRFVIRGALPRIILTSGFLLLFLLLVRPSPSVLRAGVMAAVILLARATGNSRSAVSALAAAISLLLLLDPFQAHDPGFVLSVLATGGLIFLAPSIKAFLSALCPPGLQKSSPFLPRPHCCALRTSSSYLVRSQY